MQNPNGPYPGRQLFVGIAANGAPAFLYLVTGRSPASRERRAIIREDTVIMGPVGTAPYDPLRHYTAVKHDNVTGVLAVTNGIQTEAIYEVYKLLLNVSTPPESGYLEKLMTGAKSEPDSLNTPRIAAVVTKSENRPVFYVAIARHDLPVKVFTVTSEPGTLSGISTYAGDIENPTGYNAISLAKLSVKVTTPGEMAQYLYDISVVSYKGDDIRVCSVGGVYQDGKWELALVNRFNA